MFLSFIPLLRLSSVISIHVVLSCQSHLLDILVAFHQALRIPFLVYELFETKRHMVHRKGGGVEFATSLLSSFLIVGGFLSRESSTGGY